MNIFFFHFAFSEDDILSGNFFCKCTWVDEKQDKNRWYKENNKSFILDDIHFRINQMYFEMKKFNNENMLDDATYDKTIMPITSDTINTAERIISVYYEFKSKNISELDFSSTVETYFRQINQLYLKLSNLGLPSEKRQNIDGIYMELISAVHDIVLSYIPQNFLKSTPQSRSNVIENRIQKYHIALDNLKNELK